MIIKRLKILFSTVVIPLALIQADVRPIDPSFDDYVTDFIYRSEGRVGVEKLKFLTIHFNELEYSEKGKGTIGLCYWGIPGDVFYPPKIEIDKTFWEESSVFQQWALIFHELGHCVCSRQHTEEVSYLFIRILDKLNVIHTRSNRLSDGCPISLMHPTSMPDWCLEAHQKYYVHELFDKCRD